MFFFRLTLLRHSAFGMPCFGQLRSRRKESELSGDSMLEIEIWKEEKDFSIALDKGTCLSLLGKFLDIFGILSHIDC